MITIMVNHHLPFFLLIVSSLIACSIATPTISVTPTLIPKSGTNITLTWSNIPDPTTLDWVGLYSPPESHHHHFIGYFFLSSSPGWQSGSGSITFPLLNLRHPYQFRIFRWTQSEVDTSKLDHDRNPIPRTKHLLAQSQKVSFEKPNGPEQVHLSFTDKVNEMRVVFVAGDGGKRFVKYGLNENELGITVETAVETYKVEDMCDAPANQSVGWRDPGFVHTGVMTKLKNGISYYYKVGNDEEGWSPIYSFISRDEDSDETLAFLFGDMGTATPYRTFIRTQQESIATIKWILRDIEALGDRPAFISHIGDISYAKGYSWIWDNFFNQIEPVASKVAYHVCMGNHEYDWPEQPWKPEWAAFAKDGGGECGVPYSLKFNMPGNSSFPTGTHAPPTRNLYYSFDVGSVHFVYFSTEIDFLQGSPQYNFLKNDLANVDRKRTPFVVVQGHRPMYTTSNEVRDAPLREKMQHHLEPLLVKNNVTLALWGHVHRYERFCPMNNFTCGVMGLDGEMQGGYPVHVVIGMGGQEWQPIWEPRPEHTDLPIFPQPSRSLYRGGEFGYTRLVATKEKLTLSYVGNHDGEVHDMVEILATGEVLNGDGTRTFDKYLVEGELASPIISQLVKGGSFLLLGAFVGYIIGFVSHSRRNTQDTPASGNSWLPIKTTEES